MNIRKMATLMVAAFMSFGLHTAHTVFAADFSVSSTSACTLADAIRAANRDEAFRDCTAGQGADTIRLASDISIDAPLPTVRSNITIDGVGEEYRISGGNSHQILGTVQGARLTLRNLSLHQGYAAGMRGGALRMLGGKATLSNVYLEENSASNGGGALRVHNASLICEQCWLLSNSSSHGGAVWVGYGGDVTLTGSLILNNSGDYGGAIYNQYGRVTLRDSAVGFDGTGNHAVQGGGVYSRRGTVNIEGSSRFTGNTASDLGSDIFGYNALVNIAPSVSISPDGQHYRR